MPCVEHTQGLLILSALNNMEPVISDERVRQLEKSLLVSDRFNESRKPESLYGALMPREALRPVLEKFLKVVKQREGKGEKGRAGFSYLVHGEDKPNIGYGHQMVKGDRELFSKLFGNTVNYDDLLGGKTALTEKQMDKLARRDAKWKYRKLQEALPNLNTFSDELTVSLIDSYFRGGLPDSPKTLGLLKEGKFSEASKEFLDNEEYRQSKGGYGKKGHLPGIAPRMEIHAAEMLKEESRKK